jgi:hypothetical protein
VAQRELRHSLFEGLSACGSAYTLREGSGQGAVRREADRMGPQRKYTIFRFLFLSGQLLKKEKGAKSALILR